MHYHSHKNSNHPKNNNSTKNKPNKTLIAASLLALLAACSSAKDDLKAFSECAIAATHLEKTKAKSLINKKLEEYIQENQIQGSAREAMFLAEEVREDLGLHKKNFEGRLYTLVKTYNSSKCTDIHEQEKISMPLKYYFLYFFI